MTTNSICEILIYFFNGYNDSIYPPGNVNLIGLKIFEAIHKPTLSNSVGNQGKITAKKNVFIRNYYLTLEKFLSDLPSKGLFLKKRLIIKMEKK